MKNQPSPPRARSESSGGEHPAHICAEIWFLLLSRKWATNMRHSLEGSMDSTTSEDDAVVETALAAGNNEIRLS